MLSDFTSGQPDSIQCRHCGMKLAARLLSCPSCGANQSDALGWYASASARLPAPRSSVHPVQTQLAAPAAWDSAAGIAEDEFYAKHDPWGEPKRSGKLWFVVTGGVLAVAAATGYLLLRPDASRPVAKATYGAVTAEQAGPPATAASKNAMTTAEVKPAASATVAARLSAASQAGEVKPVSPGLAATKPEVQTLAAQNHVESPAAQHAPVISKPAPVQTSSAAVALNAASQALAKAGPAVSSLSGVTPKPAVPASLASAPIMSLASNQANATSASAGFSEPSAKAASVASNPAFANAGSAAVGQLGAHAAPSVSSHVVASSGSVPVGQPGAQLAHLPSNQGLANTGSAAIGQPATQSALPATPQALAKNGSASTTQPGAKAATLASNQPVAKAGSVAVGEPNAKPASVLANQALAKTESPAVSQPSVKSAPLASNQPVAKAGSVAVGEPNAKFASVPSHQVLVKGEAPTDSQPGAKSTLLASNQPVAKAGSTSVNQPGTPGASVAGNPMGNRPAVVAAAPAGLSLNAARNPIAANKPGVTPEVTQAKPNATRAAGPHAMASTTSPPSAERHDAKADVKTADVKAADAKASAAKAANDRSTRDVNRNLQLARTMLAKDDLSAARAHLALAIGVQPKNPDAQSLNASLNEREQQRDAVLQQARNCELSGRWICAWHNAGSAMVMDSGSGDAKRILSHAMQEAEGPRTPAAASAFESPQSIPNHH